MTYLINTRTKEVTTTWIEEYVNQRTNTVLSKRCYHTEPYGGFEPIRDLIYSLRTAKRSGDSYKIVF